MLAAKKVGIKTVILPKENEKDLDENYGRNQGRDAVRSGGNHGGCIADGIGEGRKKTHEGKAM